MRRRVGAEDDAEMDAALLRALYEADGGFRTSDELIKEVLRGRGQETAGRRMLLLTRLGALRDRGAVSQLVVDESTAWCIRRGVPRTYRPG